MSSMSRGWRSVATIAALTWLAWAIVLTIAIGGLEPFVIVTAVIPIAAWGATVWRPNRITYTIFGALGLLAILFFLPTILEDVVHPESAFGFNTSVVPTLASLLMIGVGVAAWAPLGDRSATRAWATAATLFGIGLVVSIVAAAGLEDDEAIPGDVTLVAESAEWSTASLAAEGGTVAVFVRNQDPVRHTFSIDELDVDVELPAGTDRRVQFSAPPGTYTYFCAVTGHDSMTGTIVIAP
jgi:plastocyanin